MIKLSEYCKNNYNISNRLFKKYLKNKQIEINGIIISKNIEISPNDSIRIKLNKPDLDYNLNNFLIKKLEYIIFFYKPPFMHSERHSPEDKLTIEDIVKKEFENFKLITRLDFETDGIIAAVKDNYKINHISKTYIALVNGVVKNKISINNKIDAKKRKKVKVLEEKTNNITIIEPYKIFKNHTIVKVKLKTATRHQIRAYLSYLGFPIFGDSLYGNNENHRLMLHCKSNEINEHSYTSNQYKKFISIINKIASK